MTIEYNAQNGKSFVLNQFIPLHLAKNLLQQWAFSSTSTSAQNIKPNNKPRFWINSTTLKLINNKLETVCLYPLLISKDLEEWESELISTQT